MYRRGSLMRPLSLDTLAQYLLTELNVLERVFAGEADVHLSIHYAEPARPRNGMVIYADGTEWNPGAGEGFYGREAGVWVKL